MEKYYVASGYDMLEDRYILYAHKTLGEAVYGAAVAKEWGLLTDVLIFDSLGRAIDFDRAFEIIKLTPPVGKINVLWSYDFPVGHDANRSEILQKIMELVSVSALKH